MTSLGYNKLTKMIVSNKYQNRRMNENMHFDLEEFSLKMWNLNDEVS